MEKYKEEVIVLFFRAIVVASFFFSGVRHYPSDIFRNYHEVAMEDVPRKS